MSWWFLAGSAHRRGVRVGAVDAALPEVGVGEVVWSRVAQVATARAEAAVPAALPAGPPEPDPGRWWRVPVLRRVARRLSLSAVLPALVLLGSTLAGWNAWTATVAMATSDTAVVPGDVVSVENRLLPFLPYEAHIHFHVHGAKNLATVPVSRKLQKGQAIDVQYSIGNHARARLDGPGDGLTRAAATTGAMAAVGGGLVAARLRRVGADMAGLVRARRGPGRPWRYVRFVDPTGSPGLILFSRLDDGPPVAVVRLARPTEEMPPVPVTGEALVHGDVADGGPAVPVIEGRTHWPLGRACAVPPGIVRDLVNGHLPARRR